MSKLTRSVVGVASALAVAVGLTAVILAHAHLEKTEPVDGSTINKAPEHIQLMFNSKVDVAVSSVDVTGPAGKVVLGDVHGMDKDNTLMAVIKGEMAEGGYTVTWKTAAADGHPANGTFAFTLKKAATH